MLRDIDFKRSYRSNVDCMINDFYLPIFENAITYKRAVGYFTISSLINTAQGLSKFIKSGGTIKIVASPKLDSEDIKTISLGYRMKEDVIVDSMIREISNLESEQDKMKLNYIATLIADNRLEIKIAVMEDYGAYHEKFGIVEDINGDKIVFTGSMNETNFGQRSNFESFVLFKSWESSESLEYVDEYEENFVKLWENKTNKLEVLNFPQAVKNKILEYRNDVISFEEKLENTDSDQQLMDTEYPEMPSWFNPRNYQIEAITNWRNNDFKGLLTMATGTGKTLTGLYGVTELWKSLHKLVTIIVCPYQHLVEQWAEDVREFNIFPLLCYSKYNWREMLYRKINMINFGTIDNFTVLITNDTFSKKETQDLISKINAPILLIVDEAHNAGTESMKNSLDNKYLYRLGLSATPSRFRDEENTNFIFDFFGGEVFSFDLERAISEGFLTKYYYFPIKIYLTEEEQAEYDELTHKIAKNLRDVNGKKVPNEYAEMLLIMRSKIIAGASNKLVKLREIMKNYRNKNNILVYCGSSKTLDDGFDEKERQIEKVCKILGNELDMSISKFTSEESPEDRKEIIDMFSDGQTLQAIVAIKCLDEGVNIPAIQHAFILASSTNPKEFIQRRGRVLRTYKGKDFAYIYDFITLPYTTESDEEKNGVGLVKTELLRVEEFVSLAENKEDGQQFIAELREAYNVESELDEQ